MGAPQPWGGIGKKRENFVLRGFVKTFKKENFLNRNINFVAVGGWHSFWSLKIRLKWDGFKKTLISIFKGPGFPIFFLFPTLKNYFPNILKIFFFFPWVFPKKRRKAGFFNFFKGGAGLNKKPT